jgi:molybdopterin-guanine dinucleotide biosynthesis protein A
VTRRALTGVLLVGGASRRFGSPKALAELDGETLAERGWRVLGEACEQRLAVGKRADGLPLPFPIVDDGTDARHPAAGIATALRHASYEVCVVLPVDCPSVRPDTLQALGGGCADAATPGSDDPLPAAFRRTALAALERCVADGLPLGKALAKLEVRMVPVDRWELANVNVPADLEAIRRRERAVAAASETARRHGLDAPSPRVLQDWNDTVVHLSPHPVVARVATSWIVSDKEEAYRRELAVAAHAAARGGPCVRPSSLLPPGPHRVNGLVLALWEHLDAEPGEADPAAAGQALRAFHASVADFDGLLPRLEERHERAAAVAADLRRPGSRDRELLRATLDRLRAAFAERARDERVLHGGPHESNLIRTSEGPRWIDLDTVCRGPLEWDLAHLPAESTAAFPDVDHAALDVARALVSAEVAIWCWHSYGRAPEVDAAASFHLERVRRLAADSV